MEERDVTEKEEVNWYNEGVHAGKTDGWMNLEETLSEDIEHHPEERDYASLVQGGMDGWEQTDHFQILYESKMMGDARDKVGADAALDEVIDVYQDYKTEFWEGYLAGRKSIGIDIYAKAKKLLSSRKRLSAGKGKSKRGRASAKTSVKGLRR